MTAIEIGIMVAIGAAFAFALSRKEKGKAPTGPDAWHVKPLKPGWHYGPIVHDVNRTRGMPGKLVATANGFRFKFPGSGGSVHAVQSREFNLVGKAEIVVRYRITGDAKFVPTEVANRRNPARIALVIQRNGDDWSAAGERNFFRMYARGGDALAPGTHELRVPLRVSEFGPVNGGVLTQSHFDANLRDMHSLHIAFGSSGGRAHGVFAEGDTEFELLGIEVN